MERVGTVVKKTNLWTVWEYLSLIAIIVSIAGILPMLPLFSHFYFGTILYLFGIIVGYQSKKNGKKLLGLVAIITNTIALLINVLMWWLVIVFWIFT